MKLLFHKLATPIFILSVMSVLVACGGGGSSGGGNSQVDTETQLDKTAPTAEIMFPTLIATTENDSLLVRGTAKDANKIASVKVNGLEATTSDNYANWQVRVPLNPGANTLVVSASDSNGNTENNAATAAIKRELILHSPKDMVIDELKNRALVISGGGIIAVDLNDGTRSLLSSSDVPSGDNRFISPRLITLDSVHNRALVVDRGLDSIVAVDLTSGARTIFFSGTVLSEMGLDVGEAESIIVDSANNRALLAHQWQNGVLAIDLTSGAISGFDSYYAGIPLFDFSGLALDKNNDRVLLVNDRGSKIVNLALADGTVSMLSALNPKSFNVEGMPGDYSIAVDAAHNRALMLDRGLRSLTAIDLDTGERSLFAKDFAVSRREKHPTDNPVGMVVDSTHNRLLIADAEQNEIIALDLATGARSVVSDNTIPDSNYHFRFPTEIVLDDEHNRALIADRALGAIVAVDLNSGVRSALSSSDAIANTVGSVITDMALDPVNNRVLLSDQTSRSVVAVDLTRGDRSTLLDLTSLDAMPYGLIVDEARGHGLVADVYSGQIFTLNLTSGETSALWGGDNKNAFSPDCLALDAQHNRILAVSSVFDNEVNSWKSDIYTVDATNGNSKILSADASQTPDNRNLSISSIVMDKNRNRALVVSDDSIYAIDLTTGARSLFVGEKKLTTKNYLFSADDIIVDDTHDRALVTDFYLNAVVAVDLITGEQVIFSR